MRFLKSTTTLLLLVLPILSWRFSRAGKIDEEKRERATYLETLSRLYEAVGPGGRELAQRQVLAGLLADALNRGKTPREERTVRNMELLTLEEKGEFGARIVTESLATSLEYLAIDGSVDFAAVSVSIGNVEQLDPSLFAQRKREKMKKESITKGYNGAVDEVHVNNGSKGIHELLELADHTKCKKSILDECERGSVVMDTWANHTLAFQRWLQQSLTFDLTQTLGTHNSFNNKADGYGTGDFTLGIILEALSGGKWEFVWAQQWFSMTDQLQMGVRHLMLDPVYVWGKMRLCHCGTTFKWFDDVLEFIEKALNITIQFDSADLGCMPYDRTLAAGLQEIYNWAVAPGNQGEMVVVHINDESHSADWDHIDLIQHPVPQIFRDLLFTPEDKNSLFPNSWPTPNELMKLGKRVITTCTSRCNDSHIFLDMHIPSWDHNTMKYFTAAPKCGGFGTGQFYLVGGESQIVGPIYNGPEDEGLVTQENLPYLMQCPVAVSEMDIVSPALVAAAIWTWAPGYSYDNVTSTMCAAVDAEMKGRWVVLSCSTRLLHMCQSPSNITQLAMSADSAPWGQAQCPSGYQFSLPQTGYVNWNLYDLITSKYGNTTKVWINLPLP